MGYRFMGGKPGGFWEEVGCYIVYVCTYLRVSLATSPFFRYKTSLFGDTLYKRQHYTTLEKEYFDEPKCISRTL